MSDLGDKISFSLTFTDANGQVREVFPQQVKSSMQTNASGGGVSPRHLQPVSGNGSDTGSSSSTTSTGISPSNLASGSTVSSRSRSGTMTDKKLPPCPYDHLVLTVHGIGKHESDWVTNIKRINKVFNRIFYSLEKENFEKRVKFIGTEWHSGIHNHLGSTISDVTPAVGIPAVRQMVDNTVMDFLMFSTPSYADPIYKEVSEQLNTAYQSFIKEYPNFNGKVSILAHSLGSIITWDILTNQPILDENEVCCDSVELGDEASTTKSPPRTCTSSKCNEHGNISIWKKLVNYSEKDREIYHPNITFTALQFPVYNFYLIGSPVGALLSLRKHKNIPIPRCTNLYNIYNTHDPVSYLIEPLIDRRFLQQEIVYLPKFHKKLNKLPKKFKKSKKINHLIAKTVLSPVLNSSPSPCLLSAQQQFQEVSIVTQTNITNIQQDLPDNASLNLQQQQQPQQDINDDLSNTSSSDSNGSGKSHNHNHSHHSHHKQHRHHHEESSSESSDDSDDDSGSNEEDKLQEEELEKQAHLAKKKPIPNLFGGIRYDYALKPRGFHISAYTPMFTAHSSYWLSKEVLSFIGINLN